MAVGKIEHKTTIFVDGIKMHFTELGQGPLVLFIHGLPEDSCRSIYMRLVADQGYRVVAPDMRGYGDTTGAPICDPSKLSIFHLVSDLILLLDTIAPNEYKVFVVGHDWGVYVAWHLCLYRLNGSRTLVNLSDPWNSVMNPAERAWSFYGDDHHYIRGFQEPGENIGAESKMVVAQDVLKNIRNHEPNASGARLFPAPPAAPGTEALTATCPVLLVSPRQYKSWVARVPKDVALVVMNEDYSPGNTINIHGIRPNVSKQDLLNYFSIFVVLKLILINCFFFALLIWVLDWF
ncbi:hypothetical protein CASFOL_005063 [Castilleja foliolosa]|uniref:AB hydrolase-1 domain-containing protein n=1 Tax=Castilleja foliolosa TaxID=1961234 RepID=A0ABD3E2C6_9LAMI